MIRPTVVSLAALGLLPLLGVIGRKLNGPLVAGGDVKGYTVSPDGRTVVYLADQERDEVFELYAVPASGGTSTRISMDLPSSWDVESFQISSDSRRVVYRAQETGGFAKEIFSVPILGGVSTRLNIPLQTAYFDYVHDYAISPDATTVVYTSSPDGYRQTSLFAVPIGGGVSLPLYQGVFTSGTIEASYFEISPDSSRVVFQKREDLFVPTVPGGNPYLGLFSVPIDGGTVAQLARPAGYCLTFDVTPDSSRVVYTANQDVPTEYDLYSVPIDGGTSAKLNPQLGGGTAGVVSFCPFASCVGSPPTFLPTWSRISPDSSHVVFTASASSSSPRQLYSAPIAGGMATVLSIPAPNGIPDGFSVSPDSSRVVYAGQWGAGGSSTALYSVPLGGGSSVQLNPPLVQGGGLSLGAISPDATTVVYAADQDVNDVVEVYSVPLTGGATTKISGPMTGGGGASAFGLVISPDSRFAVYRADEETDGVFELFRATLDGSLPAKKLNGSLVAGGNVGFTWSIGPDSRHVLYLADEVVDETIELFVSAPFRRLIDERIATPGAPR